MHGFAKFVSMALFPGQPDPEKLIGMKPEELKARLDSAVTKDDLKQVTDQFGQFSAGMDEIRSTLQRLAAPPPPPPPPEDPTDPTTAMLTDPKGFIRRETQGLSEEALSNKAMFLEMRARADRNLKKAFDKYGDEMVATANKMPLQSRAQDGFWAWHTRTFLGDKMVTGKIDAESYPSLIGSSTIGVDSGDRPDPNQGFDPQVAEWLKNRSVPLDKAARIHQIMGVNGDPLNLAKYKGEAERA